MDQDRQGFVEFVEHVHPMRSVYTEIAKTGRGLYTKLNMERGKHFNDLCKNMQGLLNMIAQGKIKVNKDESDHGGQFRGAGDSIMVGRGMLADLRQLMQKVANATQQTAVAVQSQNPIPNPYVRELQDKQAQYLELLNKPNKTALDQFYIKRLGLRIKELIERVQTEQAAPKSVTLKEPTLREGVGEALEDAAQNNTLNLVQQRRPRKKAGRPPPKQEKEQQQDKWEEAEGRGDT